MNVALKEVTYAICHAVSVLIGLLHRMLDISMCDLIEKDGQRERERHRVCITWIMSYAYFKPPTNPVGQVRAVDCWHTSTCTHTQTHSFNFNTPSINYTLHSFYCYCYCYCYSCGCFNAFAGHSLIDGLVHRCYRNTNKSIS